MLYLDLFGGKVVFHTMRVISGRSITTYQNVLFLSYKFFRFDLLPAYSKSDKALPVSRMLHY